MSVAVVVVNADSDAAVPAALIADSDMHLILGYWTSTNVKSNSRYPSTIFCILLCSVHVVLDTRRHALCKLKLTLTMTEYRHN